MMLPALALVAALGQQPLASQPQSAGFDSAKALVGAVGMSVAQVKSALDQYRRAVFNLPDGEVLSAADNFRTQCHTMDSVTVAASRRICRACAARAVQAALNSYRNELPGVGRTGARCAAQLARLSRGSNAAKQLRQNVRVVGNAIVAGLIPYERRLEVLREAAGWAPQRGRARPARPRS